MELKLNVSRVLILDTEFTPNMLDGDQAVLAVIEGKSVLMLNVDSKDVREQVLSQFSTQQEQALRKIEEKADIVEYKGERWSVIGESDSHYIATEPYFEMDGDTINIPKNEAKIIK